VRAHEPSVHGLEKFMDFGFINSILRTDYFPPKDMWFTPFPINYYFFGHLCAAVLTKFSGISSNITYNLMIATIFSFTFTGAFSIIYNLLSKLGSKKSILGGLIGGALLSLGGNIHTIYSFFTAYQGEKPVPFWDLLFVPNSFPNGYWYPNATRFIPFTIHEFPIYSFVVSDLHGHVSDIPFVLLTGALLLSVLIEKNLSKLKTVVISLMLAIMYMTNVWDGIIYLLLFGLILLSLNFHLIKIELYKSKRLLMFPKIKNVSQIKKFLEKMIYQGGTVIILYFIFTLPFSINFKPFVSGIGILCPPEFLTNIKSLGPFIFEADHCQKSPLYQLFILYGFFYFFVLSFILFLFRIKSKVRKNFEDSSNVFVFLLIILGTVLIIVPEFLYAKDIYPQHYRANTMFKLVYQAFILLSLSSSYIIIYLFSKIQKTIWKFSFTILTLMLLSLVFVYPYYAISSYYGELKNYKGLDGLVYLKTLYSGDLEAINYLNKNISGQPVILEAQGDSYTDYARISANTGLPTVLGWTVHEWLWRGTYDIPSPRIDEVKKMYEEDNEVSIQLMSKYDVKYVIVGQLEKEKYPKIDEDKFRRIGKIIFKSSDNKTLVYEIKGL
jgi:YYY domain-containing protein